MRLRTAIALGLAVALGASDEALAERTKPARKDRRAKKTGAKAPDRTRCEEPAPVDPDLAAGLVAYAAADWVEAARRLHAWATKPTAAADPAAARGFYSLSYAMRARGQSQQGVDYARKALAVLESRADAAPSLEALYYMSSAYQMVGDTTRQLEVVSRALKDVTDGTLCPAADADDTFRLARLEAAAGHRDRELELLRKAAELHDAGQGRQVAYRALTWRALGDQARAEGLLAEAESRYRAAATTDPSIAGVHRDLGLVLIAQGKLRDAATYWGRNWTKERADGNALMYAVPLLGATADFQDRFGASERIDTAQFTVPALEQNAIASGRTVLELRQAVEASRAAGTPDATKESELAVAEYRVRQFLVELLVRGHDLPGFCLQNGLLPVVHGRSLPG